MITLSPLVVGMFEAAEQSLINLRTEIKNQRFGLIENGIGYILFEFHGQTYKAPEPTVIIFGINAELDKRMALRSLLDNTAKTNDGLSFEEGLIKTKFKQLKSALDKG